MSATRGVAELSSRENGGVVVFVAMLLPVVLLFLALSIDIGNWWVHKRHLQLQVDAAALAGGALFGGCFTDAAGTNVAIQNEATRFGGAGGSSYNGQVGGSNQGTISLLYQSATYAAGSVGSDDTETQPPCDTPSLMFDVKGSEANLPLIFKIPGLSDVGAINAHARVQLRLVEVQEGMLPVAVPDLRFTYVFATFVNEVTGAVLGPPVQLERSGTSGNDQLWTTPAGIPSRSTPPTSECGFASSAGPIRTLPAASCTRSVTTPVLRTASSTSGAGAQAPRRLSATRGSSPDPVFRTRTSRSRTAVGASRPTSTSARRIRSPEPT